MSSERGLSSAEVAARVEAGLVNTAPPRTGRTTWQVIAANVVTRINVILLVLFLVVVGTGHLLQGAFGLLILANSAIGTIQELRAKRTLDALAVVSEARPVVIRDGRRVEIAKADVVQGDLVVMAPGDQVIVDGSVVGCDGLELDESMLTGESDPVVKAVGDEVLSGTFVVAGTGTYRAEKVGGDAYAARITSQASAFTLVRSELRQGIDQILRVISFLLVPTAALSIITNFRQPDTSWREAVLRTTASLVPMVPEGLVLLTSAAFALGVVRLGRRQCLVQELPAIEGLARVDVVCADKTGTLTDNALRLSEVVVLERDMTDARVRTVLAQVAACDPAPNQSMTAIGRDMPCHDPWEVASRIPFSSARKYSGVEFVQHGTWLIGAPDVLDDGGAARRAEEIGASGRRVLLLARRTDPGQQDVRPVALVVLDQHPRPDAAATLEYFASQDVEVKVLSGDNAASVSAVTRGLGLDHGEAVDARRLPEGSLDRVVETHRVFGRVTPEQKRAMVASLQRNGHVVAMTGDGVNDVLALKDADLGVAMGSGAPATRSVAQVVLLDDRFATLPHVVAEGRRVIGNIERVARLFLTKTIYSVALAFTMGVLQLPFPLKPLQITVVGWFTIGVPAFLLSLAPNHDRARTGFVQRTLSVGIPWGMVVAAVTAWSYVAVRGMRDVPETLQRQASTAALAALIITASWVLAVVARPWVWWRVALVLLGYAFYTGVFMWPVSARLLELDLSNPSALHTGVGAGLVGAVTVELVWWVAAHLRGDRPRVFGQWRRASER